MDRDEVCIIPRNLNEADKAFHVMNRGLGWKQIGYIGVGVLGAYAIFQISILPIAIKLSASIFSIGVMAMVGTTRIKGQQIDELAVNAVIYGQRRIYYNKIERGMNFGEDQRRSKCRTAKL